MLTPAAHSVLPLDLTGRPALPLAVAPETSALVVRLTRGLAAGDEVAFREFHDAYFNRLYQFLLVVARGREEEAQEALQQTLLRVVRYARVFESETVFWDWLKVLARSAARDGGRKRQRYAALLEDFALRWQRPPPQGSQAEDRLRDLLAGCLEQLDPEDRRLVEAKYLEGATVQELADRGGLTVKAVESRLVRLRRLLRELLIQELHQP